ncbi:hypothetical protein LINPERHAP2_LOCUS9670, partial [Linum perenne]
RHQHLTQYPPSSISISHSSQSTHNKIIRANLLIRVCLCLAGLLTQVSFTSILAEASSRVVLPPPRCLSGYRFSPGFQANYNHR